MCDFKYNSYLISDKTINYDTDGLLKRSINS